MSLTIKAQGLSNEIVVLKDLPDWCPRCHRGISPVFLHAVAVPGEKLGSVIDAAFWCTFKSCSRAFIGEYSCTAVRSGKREYHLKALVPIAPRLASLPAEVAAVSPDFAKIYREAKQAEDLKLLLVAGPGYRKALEFLIKDYCGSRQGADAKAIREKWLGKVISEHIPDENIKVCAARAAWLGNDEVHYLRDWPDHDLDSLKDLISLTINWIDSSLRTEKYRTDMPP
jgi:hypothetical protein